MTSRLGLTLPDLRTEVLTVAAVVDHILPGHYSVPDGLKPVAGLTESQAQRGYPIYFPLVLSHMHVLVDHRAEQTGAFVLRSGRLTGGGMVAGGGFPGLMAGLRYVLVFIPGLDTFAHVYTQKWLVVYAACRIDEDELVILREPGAFPNITHPGRQPVPLAALSRYLAGDAQEL